jgi:hypothetical protein
MSRVAVPQGSASEVEDPESHVLLPIVSIGESPNHAISVMRHTNRAAVLATSESGVVLLTAADIAAGRKSGADKLTEINPTATFRPDPNLRSQFQEVFELPGGVPSRLGFVLRLAGGEGRLVTGNSKLNIKFGGGLRDLYCDGPGQHDTFPPPQPSEGDRCPYGDGYIVSV